MIKATINQLLEKVRTIQPLASPSRHDLARDWGDMAGHKAYTHFIILGRSRSGSNFLRGLLNSHGRVVAFGELFQHEAEISWGLSGYPQSPELMRLFLHDPRAFVEENIFCHVPKTIQAVGFKLFYYHAHSEMWQPIWAFLREQPSLKVIHIKRDNLLRVHLSRKRALLTDRWVNLAGTQEAYPAVTLDYEECLQDFIQTREWEEAYDGWFADQARLTVHYETLVQDHQQEMARVQHFLGVEPKKLVPETHQQSTDSLASAITNYAELKERFAGTEWHVFFDE